MNKDKQYTEGISVNQNKFLTWLDNYWYHYKWVTLVVAFLIIVFTICIVQSCTSEVSDIKITYAGPIALDAADKVSIEGVLTEKLPNEFSDDAKAGLLSFYILSQEQIEHAEKETHSDGERVYVDRSFITTEMDNFESQLQTGTSSVLLLDPWLYQYILGDVGTTNMLKPLKEVLGEVPAEALDDYGIRLGDTDIYKSNPELRCLPEDTVVCLFEKLWLQKQKDYDKDIAAFKAFVAISPKTYEKDRAE